MPFRGPSGVFEGSVGGGSGMGSLGGRMDDGGWGWGWVMEACFVEGAEVVVLHI